MNDPKTKPIEELQIVEDPNYVPPPENEERIYDPYMENEAPPRPNSTKVQSKLTPYRRKSKMEIFLGCTLTFVVIVGGWGVLFLIAEATGEYWIAGIPLYLLAAIFCYCANQNARSEAVREGVRRADRDKRRADRDRRRRRRRKNLD